MGGFFYEMVSCRATQRRFAYRHYRGYGFGQKTSRLQWDEAGGPRWDFRGAVHDFVLRAYLQHPFAFFPIVFEDPLG